VATRSLGTLALPWGTLRQHLVAELQELQTVVAGGGDG